MQRHVRIGNVVAHDEESHGHVSRRGRDGITFLLPILNLEIINNGVCHRITAVAEITLHNRKRLLKEWRFLHHQIAHLHRLGQHLESLGILADHVGFILHAVARALIGKHLVRIPCPLNDKVAVVLKPSHKTLGEACHFNSRFSTAFHFRQFGLVEALHSHEGQPCMGVLFHFSNYLVKHSLILLCKYSKNI